MAISGGGIIEGDGNVSQSIFSYSGSLSGTTYTLDIMNLTTSTKSSSVYIYLNGSSYTSQSITLNASKRKSVDITNLKSGDNTISVYESSDAINVVFTDTVSIGSTPVGPGSVDFAKNDLSNGTLVVILYSKSTVNQDYTYILSYSDSYYGTYTSLSDGSITVLASSYNSISLTDMITKVGYNTVYFKLTVTDSAKTEYTFMSNGISFLKTFKSSPTVKVQTKNAGVVSYTITNNNSEEVNVLVQFVYNSDTYTVLSDYSLSALASYSGNYALPSINDDTSYSRRYFCNVF